MAIEVVVPRLGWSMDEGTFGEWLKREGEFVERGAALFVLEGEKSAQDIESFDEGILRIPPDSPRPGEIVKVGQVLAFLVAEGEAAPFEAGVGARERVETSVSASAAAPAVVASEGVKTVARPHSGRDVRATPRARRLAAQTGVDWTTVSGSGRSGRIRERDVAEAAKGCTGPAGGADVRRRPAAPGAGGEPQKQGARPQPVAARPVSRIRRTIASRMLEGAQQTAPVTLTTRCDATNLVALREQFKAAPMSSDVIPSYNDLIVKLAAVALERHPLLGSQWNEAGIRAPESFDIAVAVDTEAGLLAPVIRDAGRLSVRQIASEMRRLAERARAAQLSDAELQGGVFTVTNLGMFGIDAFTPIINLPQCAILGVGRIAREPAVLNDRVVPRDQVTLSLTFDHRIIDGAPAAKFLQDLCQGIANPGAWLVA